MVVYIAHCPECPRSDFSSRQFDDILGLVRDHIVHRHRSGRTYAEQMARVLIHATAESGII